MMLSERNNKYFRKTVLALVLMASLSGCGRAPANQLMNAVGNNDVEAVKALVSTHSWEALNQDAQMDRDIAIMIAHTGTLTPFEAACSGGNVRIVEILLDAGADVNMDYGELWETPLEIALGSDYDTRFRIARILLNHGANPNCICNGEAPVSLSLRITAGQSEQCTKEGMEMFCYLYNNTDKDTEEMSTIFSDLLVTAAKENNPEAVRFLLAEGYDVNHATPNSKETALLWASINGDIESVRLLLQNGADKNHLNAQGQDALYYAERFNHYEVAELLRED